MGSIKHSSSAVQADHKGNGSLTIFDYIHMVIYQTATAFTPHETDCGWYSLYTELKYVKLKTPVMGAEYRCEI